MTARYTPTGGLSGRRTHLNLNAGNYQPGERVLYDAFGWHVGTIDALQGDGNYAMISGCGMAVTAIKGRVPASCDEVALVSALRGADQTRDTAISAAREAHEQAQRLALSAHAVSVPYAKSGEP